MKTHLDWKIFGRQIITVKGIILMSILLSVSAQAEQYSPPACNALVSVANNLYLVDPTGKVLTQFTSDANPKTGAAISPDGKRVAYLASDGDTNTFTFQVVDKYGRQGTFSVQPARHSSAKNDDTYGLAANNPIEALSWNSNDVLRVIKFAGKDEARFEFYRTTDDLSPPAYKAADSILEQNCILEHAGGVVACIEQGGLVTLGNLPDGDSIFSVSGFEGIAPEESFTLGVGESMAPQNNLPYKVTLNSIAKNQITLSLTALDTGIGEQMQIENGSYMPETDYTTGAEYGFFATVVDAKSNLVRIDIVKSNSPSDIFDPALAWQPHREGLLFIRRTNSQAMLYLIQPDRRDHDRNEFHGPAKDPKWHLAAQVPIDMPKVVQAMRFATPSLLLLQTSDGQFSEMPIDIHYGEHESHNRPTLTPGAITPLPPKLAVQINDASTQADVLDWSCETSQRDKD